MLSPAAELPLIPDISGAGAWPPRLSRHPLQPNALSAFSGMRQTHASCARGPTRVTTDACALAGAPHVCSGPGKRTRASAVPAPCPHVSQQSSPPYDGTASPLHISSSQSAVPAPHNAQAPRCPCRNRVPCTLPEPPVLNTHSTPSAHHPAQRTPAAWWATAFYCPIVVKCTSDFYATVAFQCTAVAQAVTKHAFHLQHTPQTSTKRYWQFSTLPATHHQQAKLCLPAQYSTQCPHAP